MEFLQGILDSLFLSGQSIAQEVPKQIEEAIRAMPISEDQKLLILGVLSTFIAISFALRGIAEAMHWMSKVGGGKFQIIGLLANLLGKFGFSIPKEDKKKILEKNCK